MKAKELCFKWRMAFNDDEWCAFRHALWCNKAIAMQTRLENTLYIYIYIYIYIET